MKPTEVQPTEKQVESQKPHFHGVGITRLTYDVLGLGLIGRAGQLFVESNGSSGEFRLALYSSVICFLIASWLGRLNKDK